MDLQAFLKSDLCNNLLEQISTKTGLDLSKISQIVSFVAPLFLGKITDSLKNGGASEIISLISNQDSGNKLLSLLDHDDADEIVSKVASETDVEKSSVNDMMPMIASAISGFLNKQGGADAISSMLGLENLSKNGVASSILDVASSFFSKK
ncbi:DUF937 domain-containing protein [Campylobacter sp. 19-13652]|uniref:DUF937 domain-containing protein n=1 Tax=Campylobacter sp. 19-13652 TaxID=2840180 RepID=UPI001C790C31|nr:DUF937 domain-containing protein [Campylobacter sp. 19-13652]BCX79581.1 hypothetical protein LBC_10430 [Campylobacter sp. 19-13652]